MKNHQHSERLSWGDTVFLNLERAGMPLNVACVSVFEGEISFEDCVQFVEAKLPLIPRYLKRVVPAPFGLGLPNWEYDPEFDVRRHLHEVTLKHGTDRELKAVAGRLFSEVMDRQHPLWDMTLVRGLKDNRTGLIIRLHHCLADGIAGVGIMNVLLDASPEAPRPPKRKPRFRVPPPRDPLASFIAGFADSYSDFVNRLLSAWTDFLSMAGRVAANRGNLPTDQLVRLLPEIAAPTERIRFNVIYRGPQKFAWAEIPLADVKAVRQICGASVNDVLLALVTATVRRYLELHGEHVKGRLLRLMVPVNLRGDDSPSELGNRISLVPVTIPLDIRNLRKLLAAVHGRTEFLKHAHVSELVSLAAGLIGMFPSAVQTFVGPMMSQLPITPFNMVCTNVPGPQYPLYLLGHKMLRWYPYVPVGGEMAVNCAILSYDGMVYFGFSGDVHAAPDLGRLAEFVKASFEELREEAGLRPRRKKSPRQKKVLAKKQVMSKSSPAPTTIVKVPLPSVESTATRPTTEEEEVLVQSTA